MPNLLKKTATLLVIALVMYGIVACAAPDHTGQSQLPISSSEIKGKMIDEVQKSFEDAGFTNVQTDKIDDLIFGWLTKDGEIEKVLVDNSDNFSKGSWIASDTEIIISYHTFPEKEEKVEEETASVVDNTISIEDKKEESEPDNDVPVSDEEVKEETGANDLDQAVQGDTDNSSDNESSSSDNSNKTTAFTNTEVKKSLEAILDNSIDDSSNYEVNVKDTIVDIYFHPSGITMTAYKASELGDSSAQKDWKALVSTGKEWCNMLQDYVTNSMGRDDLIVTLYYCNDLSNTDNVLLIIMGGEVWYDYVNNINLLGL